MGKNNLDCEIKYYDEIPNKPRRDLIYGEMGTKKTTLASTYPNPLFLDYDKGGEVLRLKHIPFADFKFGDVLVYEKTRKICKAFRDQKDPYDKYGTLVIDTFSSFVDMILQEFMLNAGKNPLKDKPGYDIYGQLLNACNEIVSILKSITTANVVVIAHTQTDKDEITGAITGMPEILGSFRSKIAKHFDNVILTVKEGSGDKTKYVAHTEGYRWFQAKSRSGLPPKIINPTYEKMYG